MIYNAFKLAVKINYDEFACVPVPSKVGRPLRDNRREDRGGLLRLSVPGLRHAP